VLGEVYPSSKGYFRMFSVEYSIRLLEGLIKQYPEAECIEFQDDVLMANKTWFKNFSDEYRKRINLPYETCARVECLSPDIVEMLKQSGCTRIMLGLESGNEDLRTNLLNKKFTNSMLIEKCAMAQAAGLKIFTFNIIGFPFEQRKEMEGTLELNKKVVPRNGGVCTFFYPYKGTKLYNICKENNLLKSDDEMLQITNYNTKPSIKMTPGQKKDCIHFQRKISRYLYKQQYLTEIAHLPSSLKKYFAATHYWIRVFLLGRPLFYRIIAKFYRLLGIRVLMMRLVKNKLS